MKKMYALIPILCGMSLCGCAGQSATTQSASTQNMDATGTDQTTAEADSSEGSAGLVFDDETTAGDNTSYRNVKELFKQYPEKTVLTWVTNDVCDLSAQQILQINQRLLELDQDYFIDFQMLDSENYVTRVNDLINSDTPPDLIGGGLQPDAKNGTYLGIENNWFLPLDDDLQNTQAGQTLWNAIPEKFWETMRFSGHYYGVCTVMNISHNAYYVNKSLMEKYDITREDLEGASLNELQEILARVKEGEGDECTVVKTDWTPLTGFQTYYRVMLEPDDYTADALVLQLGDSEHQVVNLYETQEFRDWLDMMYTYQQAGYFSGGSTYFMLLWGDDHFSNYTETIKGSYEDYFGSTSNIEVIDYAPRELTPQITNLNGICSKTANPELALQALSVCMSDEVISDLFIYGIEGQDYERVDGLVDQDARALLNVLSFGNIFAGSSLASEGTDRLENWTEAINEMYEPAMGGVILNMSAYGEELQAIQNVISDYSDLLYGKADDADAALDQLNAALYEAGLGEVLEEANRQMQEGLQ
jgi:putative aldouronate transport system substrate-binding protein